MAWLMSSFELNLPVPRNNLDWNFLFAIFIFFLLGTQMTQIRQIFTDFYQC